MFDYHAFTKITTPKETRKKLNVGDIWFNGAVCLKCCVLIRSKNVHDFVSCDCKNISVDGGSYYAKRCFMSEEYLDIIIPFSDVKNEEPILTQSEINSILYIKANETESEFSKNIMSVFRKLGLKEIL